MKLRWIYKMFRRRAWALTLFAFAGGLTGCAISRFTRPVYRSTVRIAVGCTGSGDIVVPASDIEQWAGLLASYAQADSLRLLTEAANSLQIDETGKTDLVRKGSIIIVSIDSTNSSTSESLVNRLTDILIAESQAIVPKYIQTARLSQITGSRPIRPSAVINILLGSATGILASGAVFVIVESLDDSVRWERVRHEAVMGVPVLGAIARMPNSKVAMIARTQEYSPESDAISTLRANLFLTRPGHPFSTILVTSPGTQEGKSSLVANLAVSLAAEARTIIIDADMRKPSQHTIFELPNTFGLVDILLSNSDTVLSNSDRERVYQQHLRDTGVHNLYLLSSGTRPVDPTLLLTSHKLVYLLDALRDVSDFILIDSPPVLFEADAVIMATLAECTLLTINDGVTKSTEVNKAIGKLLEQQGVNLVGVVINNVKLRGGLYYYHGTTERRSLLDRLLRQPSLSGTDSHTVR